MRTHSGHTDDLPGYPPPPDISKEQELYEVDAVARGVRRLTAETQSLAEDGRFDLTAPGHEMVKRLFRHVVEGVRDLQKYAVDELAKPSAGRREAWLIHVNSIDAERMALITLRTMVSALGALDLRERRVLRLAKRIGTSVQRELEFDRWRKRDREKAKETGDLPLYDRLIRNGKKIDAQYFARLRRRVAEVERLNWSEEVRAMLGAALMEMAIGRSVHPKRGPWFVVGLVAIRGRREKVLAVTDWGRDVLHSIQDDIGLNRPVLLPMVAPPKAWRLEMDSESEGG